MSHMWSNGSFATELHEQGMEVKDKGGIHIKKDWMMFRGVNIVEGLVMR